MYMDLSIPPTGRTALPEFRNIERESRRGKSENDLFIISDSNIDLHPYIQEINGIRPDRRYGFYMTRMMINEAFTKFKDTDNNFIREFQSLEGHATKLWELYLNETFLQMGYEDVRRSPTPDFVLEHFRQKVFVEAVIAGQTMPGSNFPAPELTEDPLFDSNNAHEYFAFRTINSLLSKVRKTNSRGEHYWEMPYIKGNPFVLAHSSYHLKYSHAFSYGDAGRAIYGVIPETNLDGYPTGRFMNVTEHRLGDRVLKAGFFNHPDTENVSAILFSNFGSQQKFSRMGYLKGYGSNKVKIVRRIYNSDAYGDRTPTDYDLSHPDYRENWQDGLVIFHNPNAKIPLNLRVFDSPGIIQCTIINGRLIQKGEHRYKEAASQDLITSWNRTFWDEI